MRHDEYSMIARSIAEKIREVRLAKNFKQEYMAAKLGCSQNSYSKIEIGKTELTVRKLFHIAAIIGISASELIS
jgi:transcriptional regulator with XRE-family HTH domain